MLDPKHVLAQNVTALMKYHYGKVNMSRLARDAKTAIANIQRCLDTTTSVGIDVIAQVASAFDLQPWQIIFPELDPNNPPILCITASEKQLYAKFQIAAQEVAQYQIAKPKAAKSRGVSP